MCVPSHFNWPVHCGGIVLGGAVRNFGTAVNCWCVCVCACACVRVSLGGVSVEFKITALLMCAACTVNMLPVRTLEELAG